MRLDVSVWRIPRLESTKHGQAQKKIKSQIQNPSAFLCTCLLSFFFIAFKESKFQHLLDGFFGENFNNFAYLEKCLFPDKINTIFWGTAVVRGDVVLCAAGSASILRRVRIRCAHQSVFLIKAYPVNSAIVVLTGPKVRKLRLKLYLYFFHRDYVFKILKVWHLPVFNIAF